MEFVAPRSLLCKQAGNRLGRSPPPWLDRFQPALRFFLLTVPRPFGAEAHPPSSFPSPSAFTFDRLPVVPLRALAFRPPTGAAGERLPWGFLPLRGRNRQQLWRGFPCRAPGSLPGYPGWNFALSGRPSSTFRTPSTVCSATDPASLFHLAAAFRVSPSGVCSSLRIHSGFRRTFPLVSLGDRACGRFPLQLDCLRLQGFAPRCECGDLRVGLEHACSAPLLEVPLLGSSLLVT